MDINAQMFFDNEAVEVASEENITAPRRKSKRRGISDCESKSNDASTEEEDEEEDTVNDYCTHCSHCKKKVEIIAKQSKAKAIALIKKGKLAVPRE